MPVQKKVAKKASVKEATATDLRVYRCTCCGKEETTAMNRFYKITYSPTHKGNDGYAHICISCVRELFDKYSKKYNPEFATKVVCAELNVPFYRSLYESINRNRDDFNFGYYIRMLNNKQYQGHTFALTLANGELEVTRREAEEEAEEIIESRWSVDERRAKSEVLKMLGYDPFEGYAPKFRKKLFLELIAYLDDEELLSDNYKLAQIIQIINNNHQINIYDVSISRLDPRTDISEIEILNKLKKELVISNEKIAKENGISVKSRGEQKSGRGTLTGLMRDMREKDLTEAEVNFYDQLQSENTRWAVDISMKSMMENCMFDENDINDIIDHQRTTLTELRDKADILEEEKRLLKKNEHKLIEHIKALEEQLERLGGDIDGSVI